MVFSDSSTSQGIIQDITFLTGADTNAFTVADRTRSCNRWYYKAVIAAWRADPEWSFDDGANIAASQTNGSWTYSGTAGLAIATRTMTDDTRDYALPTNALAIQRVEILDSASNWVVVRPFDKTQIPYTAVSEFMETKGVPYYYDLEGTNLRLIPAPDATQTTVTSGLRIYVTREPDEFTASDTTQEPAIAEPFHRILSLGAAYDFALAKQQATLEYFKSEVEQLLSELKQFYGHRHDQDMKLKFMPRIERYT